MGSSAAPVTLSHRSLFNNFLNLAFSDDSEE